MRQLNFHFTVPIGAALTLWADGSYYLFYPERSIDEVEQWLVNTLDRFRQETSVIKEALRVRELPPSCPHPVEQRVMNEGKVYCLECKSCIFNTKPDIPAE